MPQFQVGNVPPNKGKPRPARASAANDAISTCREGGLDPIKIQIDSARFMFGIAAKIQSDNKDAFDHPMGKSPALGEHWPIVDRTIGLLKCAADMANKVSEFAYPKLARYDHVGDAPVSLTQNKVVVTLNVGSGPPPGIVPRGIDIEGHANGTAEVAGN